MTNLTFVCIIILKIFLQFSNHNLFEVFWRFNIWNMIKSHTKNQSSVISLLNSKKKENMFFTKVKYNMRLKENIFLFLINVTLFLLSVLVWFFFSSKRHSCENSKIFFICWNFFLANDSSPDNLRHCRKNMKMEKINKIILLPAVRSPFIEKYYGLFFFFCLP